MKFKSLPHLESPSKKPRREGNQESHNVDGRLLNTRVKDLRSKRVFSTKVIGRSPTKPGKQIEECNEGNEEKKDELGENGDVNYAVPSVERENRTDLNAGTREEFEDMVGVVNSVDLNSKFSESNGSCGLRHIDQENKVSFGVSKRVAVLDEERLQKTPPDPEMVSLQELNGNGGRKLAAGMHPSDGEKRNGFDPNSKLRLMLKPCFKRKLFRAPGSFSYKRLLPYLVDIAGGSLEDDQHNKFDNGSEKSPTSNLDDFCREYLHGDSGISPQNLPSLTPESSHGINPKSDFLGENTESPFPIDKKGSVKVPCSKPSIGSPSQDQKSSDANHDRVVEGSQVSKDVLIWESLRDNNQIDTGVVMEIDCPFPPEVQTTPHVNSKFLEIDADLSTTEPEINKSMVKIGSGNLCIADNQSDRPLEFLKGKDYSNVAQLICEENVGKRMRRNLLDSDLGLIRTSNGFENTKVNAKNNKNKLNIRNKMVWDPLVQLKLFGDPSSFSYRRLLPFVMDLVDDNTKNHVPSGDDEFPNLEEGKTMELHTRVENSSCENNCMNESNNSEFNVKQPTSDPDTDMPLSTGGKIGSTRPSDVSSERTAITQELQIEQVISDQLETESCILGKQLGLDIDPNVSSSFPTSRHESFHQERTKLFQDKPSVIDPIGLELKRIEEPSPSKTPSLSLRKGILKKNPRGCRGLCSCLSCSSFRLNAERAFEFSRNLMLDAEEVASDMVKELSYTRNMLERALDWINDESGVRVNQVKEACMRASEAETIAKGRLSQMNYELDVHSRIPCSERPKVKFATNVEERE